MKYDICIPVVDRTIDNLELVLKYIKKNIEYKRIVLIGKADLRSKCLNLGCIFVDEDELYEGLTYNQIRSLVVEKDRCAENRVGWYFQQFLKLSYAFACPDEYYVFWDADLIPLRYINFFSKEGKPYFTIKSEYHKPYFTLINNVFSRKICKQGDYSYISEHMVFKSKYVIEMLREIESFEYLKGETFYQKIVNSIHSIDLIGSGFSEFEMYGSYVQTRHPNAYEYRRIKSLREGDLFLSWNPSEDEIQWAKKSYDLINLEHRSSQLEEIRNDYKRIRTELTLDELVDKYRDKIKLVDG